MHGAVMVPGFDAEFLQKRPHELLFRQRELVRHKDMKNVPRVLPLTILCVFKSCHSQACMRIAQAGVQRFGDQSPAGVKLT